MGARRGGGGGGASNTGAMDEPDLQPCRRIVSLTLAPYVVCQDSMPRLSSCEH